MLKEISLVISSIKSHGFKYNSIAQNKFKIITYKIRMIEENLSISYKYKGNPITISLINKLKSDAIKKHLRSKAYTKDKHKRKPRPFIRIKKKLIKYEDMYKN